MKKNHFVTGFLAILLMTACTPKNPVEEGVITIDLTGNLSREKEFLRKNDGSDLLVLRSLTYPLQHEYPSIPVR